MASSEILRFVLLAAGLVLILPGPSAGWDADLELFDLVEEIPQTFYEFLSVDQVKRRVLLSPSTFLSFFLPSFLYFFVLVFNSNLGLNFVAASAVYFSFRTSRKTTCKFRSLYLKQPKLNIQVHLHKIKMSDTLLKCHACASVQFLFLFVCLLCS